MKYLKILFMLLIMAIVMGEKSCCKDSTSPDDPVPPEVQIIYPGDSLTGLSLTPLFVWTATDEDGDYLRYELTWWQSDDETQYWNHSDLADTFLVSPVELKPDTWYDMSLQATDGDGNTDKTPSEPNTHSFRTGDDFNNPPFQPDLIYPINEYNVPWDTTFYWTASDPDPGDTPNLVFDLIWWKYAGGEPADTNFIYDLTDTFYTMPTLIPNSLYCWHVRAIDPSGDSNLSQQGVARTEAPDPPGVPYYPDPDDNAGDIPVTTDLSWSCDHPDGLYMTYDVYFWKLADGVPVLVSEGQPETTWDPPAALDLATTYQWKIVAKDAFNETEGPTWKFWTEISGSVEFFAVLTLQRGVSFQDPDIYRNDWITARFDEEYAPLYPISPLQPASVTATTGETTFDLEWLEYQDYFSYSDYINGWFLEPGASYRFSVVGGGVLPGFTKSIDFPSCEHYITSPAPLSYVSLDGFELEWSSTCPGDIDIVILDTSSDSTGIHITTENDGSYTFTADDLSPLPEETYEFSVVLVRQNVELLNAPSFDPRSWVWARVLSGALYYVEP